MREIETNADTLYCYWQLDMFFVYVGAEFNLQTLQCFGSRRHLLDPAIVDHEYDMLIANGTLQRDPYDWEDDGL